VVLKNLSLAIATRAPWSFREFTQLMALISRICAMLWNVSSSTMQR